MGDERNGRPFRTNSRLILISSFPFSGTSEYTHARMSRVLFLSRVLLLEAQQEQASKLRIFLIKLSHSSSTYENTVAFQHFSDRRRTITFGLKERAILFAYSVRTVLGSSRSSSVTITELPRSILLLDYRASYVALALALSRSMNCREPSCANNGY